MERLYSPLGSAMLSTALLLSLFSFVIVDAFDARTSVLNVVEHQRALAELLESEEFEALHSSVSMEFDTRSLLSSLRTDDLTGLSTECKEDMHIMLTSIADPNAYPGFAKMALAKMLDSNGKKGSAILRGHTIFKGHSSECKEVDYTVGGRDRHFQGGYFRIDIDPLLRPNSMNGSCPTDIPLFWKVGVCFPASCSSAELASLFMKVGTTIDNPVCSFVRSGDLTPDPDAGFYITLAIMGTIVSLCVISGIAEFFFSEIVEKTSIGQSLAWRLFMSFSMYSNIASIFDVAEAGKAGQIGPIHCIRFFSMVWVLLSHLFGNYLALVANPTDIIALAPDLSTEVILNGYYSVDSFFFMSGVLLTFLWFKIFAKQPKETLSPFAWIMFYVHRIIRLSPPYYFIVLFYTFVEKQILKETNMGMDPFLDDCSESWWKEFLYIINWVDPSQLCLGYSWYLASEMQMYLFTPLLLIPLALKPVIGLIVAAAVMIISIATNIFLVYHFHWPTGLQIFHPADPETTNLENYNQLMYNSPLIRCQVYIMGMLVGWFLQTRKQLRIHPIIYLSCWIIGLSLMLTVLLGLHDQTNGTEIDLFWRAMYSAFSRPAWGVGLSVIVVMCYYGYGGPINSFMSWHIWVPLGRLSYCGYLVHLPVIWLLLSQSADEVYFSNFTEFFITRVISSVVVVFFVAVFWSACFELSFGRVEKLLLGGTRTTKSSGTAAIVKKPDDRPGEFHENNKAFDAEDGLIDAHLEKSNGQCSETESLRF